MARKSTRGAAPGAPRPKIEPKPLPFTRRRAVRGTAVAVLALLGIWIGTVVWGNVSRSNALRSYEKKLAAAQGPFFTHLDPAASTNIDAVHQQFSEGKLTPKQLEDQAADWREAFTLARDQVRALDPDGGGTAPDEVVDANALIADSLDAYLGLIGMYELAADQQRLIASVGDGSKERKALEDQLAALLATIKDARTRAGNTHSLGVRRILQLRQDWGVDSTVQLAPVPPAAPAGAPPGFTPPGLTPP